MAFVTFKKIAIISDGL